MPFINGIGPGELIIILIIALIVVGPGKLPDVGSALGKSIREFRKAATDVKESVNLDAAPAPAAQVAPPAPAAGVGAPPVVPVAAAVAAADAAAPAVAAADATPAVAASPAVEAAPAAEAGSWPAEVTPVDEQQPTASA